MRRVATAIALTIMSAAGTVMASTAAEAAGSIMIYKAYYNSPGSDTGSNSSLNGEFIVLKNVSSSTRYITGYTLRDKSSHVYKFPSTTIGPGKYMYVRTGKGTNGWKDRYWGQSWYVWNNTGDTAYLRSSGGTLLDSCTWGSTGSYKYC